jgi:hypothetical protein
MEVFNLKQLMAGWLMFMDDNRGQRHCPVWEAYHLAVEAPAGPAFQTILTFAKIFERNAILLTSHREKDKKANEIRKT